MFLNKRDTMSDQLLLSGFRRKINSMSVSYLSHLAFILNVIKMKKNT